MSPSFWIAFKALRQLGVQPVLQNALYHFKLKSGYYQKRERRAQRVAIRPLRPLFAFHSPISIQSIRGEEGKRLLLEEADEIANGKVRLFGNEPVELQLTLPGALAHWTAYEINPVLLSKHNPPFSDIKFIWEPARFGWTFCLGRAFNLTRDEKYAEAFWLNFETFVAANPPYLGPNWMSGQEVALRIMAFVWAGQIFNDSHSSTPERKAALARSVEAHALRIPPTLIYARSQQNNHLLTETAGLLTAGLALPDHPKSRRWRALGWRLLNQGLQSQIDSTGEYAQHSTNYHRLMLQVVLWVNTAMSKEESNNFKPFQWPQRTLDPIRRSVLWLRSIKDPETGRTPNLGANDGSYIFPLTFRPFADYRPIFNAAVCTFPPDYEGYGPWDEMVEWLSNAKRYVNRPLLLHHPDRVVSKDSWAYLRAAQFTNRPSHADQLHVDLWWRGLNVALDAGTYLYNADPPWDNSLTTALVHNTVTIGGHDQFTRAGRFLYLDWFDAHLLDPSEEDPGVSRSVRAAHWGFRKLGYRHERSVMALTDGRWKIRDDLLHERTQRGERPQVFRLHWLLPDWEWQAESSQMGMSLQLKSPYGPVTLRIHVSGGDAPSVDLARAGERVFQSGAVMQEPPPLSTIRGWASPTYGVKNPALSLAVETQSANDVQFISEFIFPK